MTTTDAELLDCLAVFVSPPSSPATDSPSLPPACASWTTPSSSSSSVSDTWTSPSSSSAPSLVSLEDARAEWQRLRVRLKAQRAYRRKSTRLQQLRGEVEQLERQLKLLQHQGQRCDEDFCPDLDAAGSSGQRTGAAKTREEAETRLVGSRKLAARLRKAHNELRRQFVAASRFSDTLGELLSEEYKPYISVASHLLFLRPLTPPECRGIHQRSMDVVRAFTPCALLASPQTREVAGWREQRQVERGLFRYAFHKRFSRCGSAAALATKTFLLLTEPAQLRRFYSDALNMEARLVQKVDEDNCVVFQQMRATDADGCEYAASKALLLVSRVQRGGLWGVYLFGLKLGELPVAQRHAEPSGVASRPPEFWSTQFCWLEFADVASTSSSRAGSDVEVTYAGMTPTGSATTAFWLVEVVLHCLRWEQTLIGPWIRFEASA